MIQKIKEFWQDVKIEPISKWFDFWVGLYFSVDEHEEFDGIIYLFYLPTKGLKINIINTDWYYEHYLSIGYLDDEDYHWLCDCGHYEESEIHCSNCGSEPPWGCDCSECCSYEDDTFMDDFDYEEYYEE